MLILYIIQHAPFGRLCAVAMAVGRAGHATMHETHVVRPVPKCNTDGRDQARPYRVPMSMNAFAHANTTREVSGEIIEMRYDFTAFPFRTKQS